MCGIAGFVNPPGSWKPEDAERIVLQMIGTLVHRGPDAWGSWGTDGIAFGHRRLSVIDIAGGKQPMVDPESGCTIVFNGEIYNYLEINAELRKFGAFCRTRSDTETILKAYGVWGEECLSRFNGMFSFVLYDPRARRIFGARDRMGKKPLYYVHKESMLVFGSEPKALLAHPAVSREIDWEGAARYLMFEYAPTPYSMFVGMKKLPAGHKFSFDPAGGKLSISPYWDCRFPPTAPKREMNRAEYWEELIRQKMLAAVKRRLISDVPLGVFLSGGIDSSAIVAAMVAQQKSEKVKSFTIGFRDPSFDESEHARRVASFLGTEHHEMILNPQDALEILPDIERLMDEPLADSSILATYLVATFARKSVTVALGGDGGDELFAGYDTFRALRAAHAYNQFIPDFIDREVLRPLVGCLPASTDNFSLDFVARQFLRGVKVPDSERLSRWLGSFSPEDLKQLLTPEVLAKIDIDRLYSAIHRYDSEVAGCDPITRDLYGYTKTYLADDLLVKLDRATMACSLEARSPLLDFEFVELANSIPGHLKYAGGRRLKHVFKRALLGMVPNEILRRPKKGFGVPLASWFRGPLREPLRESLSERRLRQQGYFQPKAVCKLLDDHDTQKSNNRKPLLTLFFFQRWLDNWTHARVRTWER